MVTLRMGMVIERVRQVQVTVYTDVSDTKWNEDPALRNTLSVHHLSYWCRGQDILCSPGSRGNMPRLQILQ